VTDLPRPSKDETLLTIAHVLARRSSCSRAHVGAVIAIEGRIVSTGYNGAPAGLDHCNHECDCIVYRVEGASNELHQRNCRSEQPCTTAIHAETNAIAFAARHGVGLEGATLYSTHLPCIPCSQLIINSGIIRVLYIHPYRITDGQELLRAAAIDIECWDL
jgi:dCMP deaminase